MKKLFLNLALIATAGVMFTACSTQEPYKNPKLTAEERAADLVTRLTLEEKVALMQDESAAIERLGIQRYNWWNEALHGVARAGKATVFPQAIGMAATWDDGAVYRAFNAVSDEARAKNTDDRKKGEFNRYQGLTFWTPNVNIFRDPRWGRGQETYGEDPYLTSRMGVSVVRGLQGPSNTKYHKAHACAKHYAVHSGPESSRHTFNVDSLPQRLLWEIYLPAFKALVCEANVREVMCAYNAVDGEPCCGNKQLLTSILRDLWNFNGIVVSDCWAINDFFAKLGRGHNRYASDTLSGAAAVVSGTDLECGSVYKTLTEAVEKGFITEERINTSVKRLLTARFQLGLMDDDKLVDWTRISIDTVNCKTHQNLALEMAQKSMVLLQNRNNILPISKNAKVAVVGPNADNPTMQWGNYNGFPSRTISILEGIQSKCADVTYIKGCELLVNEQFVSLYNDCKSENGIGFSAKYWDNADMQGEPVATANYENPPFLNSGGGTVFAPNVPLTEFSGKFESTFTATATNEVEISITADDGYKLIIDGAEVAAAQHVHGEASTTYKMKAIAGKSYKIEIDYIQHQNNASLRFTVGYKKSTSPAELVAGVKNCDVVVFVGGISPRLEGEEMRVDYEGFAGGDRTNIELPAVQRQMIAALAKAGKKVVLVNCSGSAMGLVSESEKCEAILQAWYPGESGGQAVADVLFGDYNPAGRLPVTFYKSVNQLPSFDDYGFAGRTYMYMTQEPLFPFGFGLSYTTFDYAKAELQKTTIKKGESAKLSLTICNTGKMSGDEVAQVYIKRNNDTDGPSKMLRYFKRVNITAGAQQVVDIELNADAFRFFNSKTNDMDILPGEYTVYYGGNSRDLQSLNLTIE